MNLIREYLLQKYFFFLSALVIAAMLLLTSPPVMAWAAPAKPPAIARDNVERLVDYALRNHWLTWDELTFPLEVPRSENGRRDDWLRALLMAGVVERESQLLKRQTEAGSAIDSVWRYSLTRAANWRDTPRGKVLVYGHPAVREIVNISSAYWVDDAWYAEVVIDWYVADLADWATMPVFRRERLFRRSRESFDKPFSRSIFMQYTEFGWQYWQRSN